MKLSIDTYYYLTIRFLEIGVIVSIAIYLTNSFREIGTMGYCAIVLINRIGMSNCRSIPISFTNTFTELQQAIVCDIVDRPISLTLPLQTRKRRYTCEEAVLITMDQLPLPPRRASANTALVRDMCPSTNGATNCHFSGGEALGASG